MQHFPTVCDPSLVKNEIMQAPLNIGQAGPMHDINDWKDCQLWAMLELNKPSYIQVDVI